MHRLRLLVFSVLMLHLAFANTAIRNAALARLEVALSQLSPLIQAAEAAQDSHDPLQVNFHALRQDVATMQIGIEAILRPTAWLPRTVTPLMGDYHEAARKVTP